MRIEGAIFDLDGTLTDSMYIWNEAPKALVRKFGGEPPEDLARDIREMGRREASEYMVDTFCLPCTPKQVMEGVNALVTGEYRDRVPMKTGADTLLERLGALGVPCGIATASEAFQARDAMVRLGLWKHFLFAFSSLQYGPKTGPDLYRAAARSLGSAPERTLRQQFSSPQVFDTAVQQLLRRKLLRSDAELTQKTGGKTVKIAALAVSAEEAEQFAAKKQTSAPLQAAVLRLLCAIGAGPCREICALTGASMQTITRLCKLGLLEQQEREVLRSPKQELPPPAEPITLTDEQQAAFDGLSAQMEREKPGAALLYGVTGSGKTAVYVALIQKALDEGHSAMLLVPEIALTPQLLGRMTAHFGKTVAVLHSSLRVGERYDEWRRIARGEARVVVGTRSAVFAPLQSPGLLILDEEQEHTYKSENAPRYHAREIALYRGA